MENGIYAKFNTSRGTILVKLTHDLTPGTVGNFVGLAEGQLENSARPMGKPYYDGLKFHRVIPDFMIQGGCPQGQGTGGPGYNFDDHLFTGEPRLFRSLCPAAEEPVQKAHRENLPSTHVSFKDSILTPQKQPAFRYNTIYRCKTKHSRR
jgi:hypothetical protein